MTGGPADAARRALREARERREAEQRRAEEGDSGRTGAAEDPAVSGTAEDTTADPVVPVGSAGLGPRPEGVSGRGGRRRVPLTVDRSRGVPQRGARSRGVRRRGARCRYRPSVHRPRLRSRSGVRRGRVTPPAPRCGVRSPADVPTPTLTARWGASTRLMPRRARRRSRQVRERPRGPVRPVRVPNSPATRHDSPRAPGTGKSPRKERGPRTGCVRPCGPPARRSGGTARRPRVGAPMAGPGRVVRHRLLLSPEAPRPAVQPQNGPVPCGSWRPTPFACPTTATTR